MVLEDPHKPANRSTTFATTFALSPASAAEGQGSASRDTSAHSAQKRGPNSSSMSAESAHKNATAPPTRRNVVVLDESATTAPHRATAAAPAKQSPPATTGASANQRLLDSSDAITRELFQPAVAASLQTKSRELNAALAKGTAAPHTAARPTVEVEVAGGAQHQHQHQAVRSPAMTSPMSTSSVQVCVCVCVCVCIHRLECVDPLQHTYQTRCARCFTSAYAMRMPQHAQHVWHVCVKNTCQQCV